MPYWHILFAASFSQIYHSFKHRLIPAPFVSDHSFILPSITVLMICLVSICCLPECYTVYSLAEMYWCFRGFCPAGWWHHHRGFSFILSVALVGIKLGTIYKGQILDQSEKSKIKFWLQSFVSMWGQRWPRPWPIAQVVSCWLITVEAWAYAQGTPVGFVMAFR